MIPKYISFFCSSFLFLIFTSCLSDEQSHKYFLECKDENLESGYADLYNWQNETTENDTGFIQIFFDTTKFDQENIINTITFTWFKDSINENFDWVNYMENETEIIKSAFTLQDKGQYTRDSINYYWFLLNDDTLTSYLEYIASNPLIIRDFVTSADLNELNDEFCILNKIASQAKSLVSP